jgi:hypothetical protein
MLHYTVLYMYILKIYEVCWPTKAHKKMYYCFICDLKN